MVTEPILTATRRASTLTEACARALPDVDYRVVTALRESATAPFAPPNE
jgi:hypothetical protein